MLACEVGNFFGESARVINGTWRHFIGTQDAIGYSNAMIILSEGRGLMYDSCAISVRHICVDYHFKSTIFVLKIYLVKEIQNEEFIR